jgi:hypothetical protein
MLRKHFREMQILMKDITKVVRADPKRCMLVSYRWVAEQYYGSAYDKAPKETKASMRADVKRLIPKVATQSAKLGPGEGFCCCPVNKLAFEVQLENLPRTVEEAKALVRTGKDLFHVGVFISARKDGALASAWTEINKHNGNGKVRMNEGRQAGWIEAGLITSGVQRELGFGEDRRLLPEE